MGRALRRVADVTGEAIARSGLCTMVNMSHGIEKGCVWEGHGESTHTKLASVALALSFNQQLLLSEKMPHRRGSRVQCVAAAARRDMS